MSVPKKYKAWLFSILNAGVMLSLALFWLGLPRTFGDEAIFIKWTSLVKKSLLGIDEKPSANSVLYVDVSGSQTCLEIPDPLYKESTGYHHTVITDRVQLATFLQKVAQYGSGIPLVIMDIYFETPCSDDSLLQATIDHFPFPVVGAQRVDDHLKLVPNVIKLPTGVANYLSSDNHFMKYPLYLLDTLPSLPLVGWGMTERKTYSNKGIWPRLDGHRSLLKPIIDFKIRPFDLNTGNTADTSGFTLRSLGTLLFEWEFWDEADIRTLLNNKTIILGDFSHDNHETIFGIIPGPLVVHNAYLTLVKGESIISWKWLLLLYLLFFWMSLRAYREVAALQNVAKPKIRSAIGHIIADSIDETFFLALGTVLSYFLFNIHINILILLIYLKFMTYLLGRFVFPKKMVASPK